MESRGSNIVMLLPYSILGPPISNIDGGGKSILAILSLYSLMKIGPNIEYGNKNRVIYPKYRYIRCWKSTRISNLAINSLLEEHPNIEFSDKLAIFDI